MPDVSSAVLDRLIQLAASGAIPEATAEITDLVNAAKKIPGIDKETLKALNLLAKRSSELQKRGVTLLRPKAETREQVERAAERGREARRTMRFRAARLPAYEEIGAQRRERIRIAPKLQSLRTQEGIISTAIAKAKKGPIDVASIRAAIAAIPEEGFPEGKQVKASLERQLNSQVTAARGETEGLLRRGRLTRGVQIRDPSAIQIGLERVEKTAHRLTPVRGAETIRLIEGAQKVAHRMPLVLKEAGLRMVPGAGEAGRTVERTGRPFLGRLLGGAGLAETGQALSEVERLKTTDPKQALAMLETATQPAVKGPRARAMKGGGIAALLLLPMLLGKMGGGQQQMSPMMQLQLLTQMAQMQQNEQLAGSLVSSRGAQSQRNLAQADLLRMQAMLAAAGGQGRASSVI